MDAARQMDELYKNAALDKSLSANVKIKINVTDPSHSGIASTINNLEYDDEGYLHFTVEADGYELEELFRINDHRMAEYEACSID